MITFDDILRAAKNEGEEKQSAEHEHQFDERLFNIEGHTVRGRVCSLCGERFFLMEDLLPLEQDLRARLTGDRPTISTEDALLLLAGTYPDIEIPGKLVAQKEMFLFEKSLAPELGISLEPAGFRPYHLGPYSHKLKEILDDLERRGFVKTRQLSGREGVAYSLTKPGKELARTRQALVRPEVLDQLRRRRRGWDELGAPGLLKLVYEDFSAYAGESKIKEQVNRGPRRENREVQGPGR